VTWRLSARTAALAEILARLSEHDRALMESALASSYRPGLRAARQRGSSLIVAEQLGLALDVEDTWQLAGKVREALERYAAGLYRFDRAGVRPADPARLAMLQHLESTGGEVRSQRQLQRLLRDTTGTSQALVMSLVVGSNASERRIEPHVEAPKTRKPRRR
jgi:hypothetical protein